MSYEPKGKVRDLLAAMQAQPEKRLWSPAELRAVAGIEHRNVASHVKGAVQNEAIYVHPGAGRSVFYSLYPPEQPEAEAFAAALWADGDLVLRGVQVNDDGSVTVAAADVTQVKRLLTGAVV